MKSLNSTYCGQDISHIYIQILRYHNGAHTLELNPYLISSIILCHTKVKNITQYLHNIQYLHLCQLYNTILINHGIIYLYFKIAFNNKLNDMQPCQCKHNKLSDKKKKKKKKKNS